MDEQYFNLVNQLTDAKLIQVRAEIKHFNDSFDIQQKQLDELNEKIDQTIIELNELQYLISVYFEEKSK
jgi:septal ring factor EnvC (AmiA/AmiB activator)